SSPEVHRCRPRSRQRRQLSWWSQRLILQRFEMPSGTLTGIRWTDYDLIVEPQVHMVFWVPARMIVRTGEPHVQIGEHAPEFFDAIDIDSDGDQNSGGGVEELENEVVLRGGTDLRDLAHEGRGQRGEAFRLSKRS